MGQDLEGSPDQSLPIAHALGRTLGVLAVVTEWRGPEKKFLGRSGGQRKGQGSADVLPYAQEVTGVGASYRANGNRRLCSTNLPLTTPAGSGRCELPK
jgi:hypothetical protein